MCVTPTGPAPRLDQKAKPHTTSEKDGHGIEDMFLGKDVSQEDWEESLQPSYQGDPLEPPDQCTLARSTQHFLVVEGNLVQ